MGVDRYPDSSIQVVPVISPLPFCENHPAKTGAPSRFPRGRMAVTPVRTFGLEAYNQFFPSPRMIVLMTDFHPGHVGDGIEAAGYALERNPKVARARRSRRC